MHLALVQTLYCDRGNHESSQISMTALCGITARGLICRPVFVGTLFAPTQGSHFQVLHPLSFIFICTLHWCKHCTVIEVTTNMRKLTITALCEIAEDGVVCGTVRVGTLFAPTQGLHFQSLHPLTSFSYAPCIGTNIVPC